MSLPEITYDPWFHDKPHPHDSMPIATDEPLDTSPSEIQPPGVDENPRPEEEAADIHQEMYRIATDKYNPFSVGGSESINDKR
tara:strand:- start:3236 stop:3484 length:249 start_codon:yes stop_codon:yes gene_type:complete